jgi:hypothetical protein
MTKRLRRRLVGCAIALALYAALRAVVGGAEAGLITPSGAVDVGLAVAGAAMLALRLWALFVLPALAVYWTVVALLDALVDRRPRR